MQSKLISFACKSINLQDIVLCSFGITKTEYLVLTNLLKQKKFLSINEISKKMSLERSTVQKAIAKLVLKELVERRQTNLTSGGYRFIYAVIDQETIKKRIRNIVDGWHKNVVKAVNNW